MDSGDKATAKAMSVAYRIALIQALNAPTGDPDPDTQTYERSASHAAAEAFGNTEPTPPRQQRNAGSRQDGPRPDAVASALAKLALQIAADPSKTVADLNSGSGRWPRRRASSTRRSSNPFGDGHVR